MEDPLVREQQGGKQSFYSLYIVENGEYVAVISSGMKNGERVLALSFPSFYSANSISRRDWDGAIAFVTRLYGGFEHADQVYDLFLEEYGVVNTQRREYEVSIYSDKRYTREGESTWEQKIGSTTCRIVLVQPALNEPEEYISDIFVTSNWDVFFSH